MEKKEVMYICPDRKCCPTKRCFHKNKHTIQDCEDFSRPRLGCPPCISVSAEQGVCRDCRHNTGYAERCNRCSNDTRIMVAEDKVVRIDLFEPLQYDDSISTELERELLWLRTTNEITIAKEIIALKRRK